MSLGLKIGSVNNLVSEQGFGLIYLDAVTQYTRDKSGQVTSHPIGSGGLISDHFIRNNPTFTISAVISAADISLGTDNIKDDENRNAINTRGGETNRETGKVSSFVTIKGNANSSLLSLVPNSVSQFFVDTESSVDVFSDLSRKSKLIEVRTLIENLFEKDKLAFVSLFEYEGYKISRIFNNLIMTRLSFDESPDTGDALYINISLEQLTITSLKSVRLTSSDIKSLNPVNTSPSISDAASPRKDVGTSPNPIKPLTETEKTILAAATDAITKAPELAAALQPSIP